MLHRPSDRETFLALLDDFVARVQEAFVAAILRIRSRVTLTQVVTYLERNDVFGAISALNVEPVAFNPLLDQLAAAYSAGGNGAANELPVLRSPDGFPISITFDPRNPQAEAWIKQNGATLVRQITDDQVAMLRRVIAEDAGQGMNPRQIALDIVGRINKATGERSGGLIGLTDSQAQWAQAYRRELETLDRNALTRAMVTGTERRAIAKAIEAKTPLANVDGLVANYRNRALLNRGETIARTETLKALNAARDENMRQTIASGAVSGNRVDAVWSVTLDGRERAWHATMLGQTVPFGQSFIDGLGNRLRYPGDPSAPGETIINCRCSTSYRVRKAN